MKNELTDAERTAATVALCSWFKSQDLMPPEASLVMLELLAKCLIDKTTNVDDLQSACENFRTALILNVALFLREKGIA